MVITFTQKRKSQKYLVLIFLVLIIVIAVIFLSDFFKIEEPSTINELSFEAVPIIEINLQFLESPIFKKLSEPFPDLPLPLVSPTGDVGRENPFVPYK